MATDIFGNNVNYLSTGIIKAQDMLLSIEGGNNVSSEGALVQNITIQCAQPIQVIREIGSRNYYYYAQLPQGSVSFGRLTAKDKTILDLLPKNVSGANIWQVPGEGQVSPQVSLSSPDGTIKYTMHQCIVESMGINVDATAQFVQEQIVLRFGSMQMTSAVPIT